VFSFKKKIKMILRISHFRFKKKYRQCKTAGLNGCPQKRGIVFRLFITTPRKPNSAKRKTARVRLSSGKFITVFIGGIGHNLNQHSNVLVCGGGARDLPGVNYRAVRGKYDLGGVIGRKYGRSKYGCKKIVS